MCSCICLKLSQTVPTHRPTSAHVVVRVRRPCTSAHTGACTSFVWVCRGCVSQPSCQRSVVWSPLSSSGREGCSSVTAASSREGREDAEQRSNNLRYQNIWRGEACSKTQQQEFLSSSSPSSSSSSSPPLHFLLFFFVTLLTFLSYHLSLFHLVVQVSQSLLCVAACSRPREASVQQTEIDLWKTLRLVTWWWST